MSKILSVTVMLLAALPALAQDAPGDKVEDATKSSEAKPGDEGYKPPPGFKTKKRGEIVVYCMKDSSVGTRFKTEKCYDRDQMREYLLALEIQKRDIDRIRSTCATGASCASN
jgi:hypothetical protein